MASDLVLSSSKRIVATVWSKMLELWIQVKTGLRCLRKQGVWMLCGLGWSTWKKVIQIPQMVRLMTSIWHSALTVTEKLWRHHSEQRLNVEVRLKSGVNNKL